jgi:hypothetical protein
MPNMNYPDGSRWVRSFRVVSQEINDHFSVERSGVVLVYLPLFDGFLAASKTQQFNQLSHGQAKIDSLFTEVFA